MLDRRQRLTLLEVCQASGLHAEAVLALVDLGVLEPWGRTPSEWRFPADAVCRLRTATRLQADLNLNPEGTALALDLLDEVRTLRARVRALESLLGL